MNKGLALVALLLAVVALLLALPMDQTDDAQAEGRDLSADLAALRKQLDEVGQKMEASETSLRRLEDRVQGLEEAATAFFDQRVSGRVSARGAVSPEVRRTIDRMVKDEMNRRLAAKTPRRPAAKTPPRSSEKDRKFNAMVKGLVKFTNLTGNDAIRLENTFKRTRLALNQIYRDRDAKRRQTRLVAERKRLEQALKKDLPTTAYRKYEVWKQTNKDSYTRMFLELK